MKLYFSHDGDAGEAVDSNDPMKSDLGHIKGFDAVDTVATTYGSSDIWGDAGVDSSIWDR